MSIEDAVGRTSALPVVALDPAETAGKTRSMAGEPQAPEWEPPDANDADTSHEFRHTSVKQTEANRRNAHNSTGPTTHEGKQASRLNTLTHGLRANEAIIPGQEDPVELEAILKELREDWQPVGHTEHHLVEEIGLGEWRLRRVHRAELGEIQRQIAKQTASDAGEIEAEIELAIERNDKRLPQKYNRNHTSVASSGRRHRRT